MRMWWSPSPWPTPRAPSHGVNMDAVRRLYWKDSLAQCEGDAYGWRDRGSGLQCWIERGSTGQWHGYVQVPDRCPYTKPADFDATLMFHRIITHYSVAWCGFNTCWPEDESPNLAGYVAPDKPHAEYRDQVWTAKTVMLLALEIDRLRRNRWMPLPTTIETLTMRKDHTNEIALNHGVRNTLAATGGGHTRLITVGSTCADCVDAAGGTVHTAARGTHQGREVRVYMVPKWQGWVYTACWGNVDAMRRLFHLLQTDAAMYDALIGVAALNNDERAAVDALRALLTDEAGRNEEHRSGGA